MKKMTKDQAIKYVLKNKLNIRHAFANNNPTKPIVIISKTKVVGWAWSKTFAGAVTIYKNMMVKNDKS